MKRRAFLCGAAASAFGCATTPARRVDLARGLWRDDEGAFAIGRFPEFGAGDFAFDYAALRAGALLLQSSAAAQISSTLDGGGAPIGEVSVGDAGLRFGGRTLRPVAIRRVPFEARSADAILSAEIASPTETGSRATILMIYGSGPAPKEAFDFWAFWFLAAGCSVVAYDKRGSGRSAGDWRVSGLEALAADARAVLGAARRKRVAEPVIGWGASQAGWILPQLSAGGLLDGVIMHAGSAVRPREQILAQVEAEMSAYGFPSEEIDRARAYYALDTDVSRGARPWEEVDAAYRKASAAGAEWLLGPPAAKDAPERAMIRQMADFDPAPYWAASRAPLLALFGGKDLVVPAETNLAALKRLVRPDVDYEGRVLPSANHLMFVAQTGFRDEYGKLSRVDADYFSSISQWLAARA